MFLLVSTTLIVLEMFVMDENALPFNDPVDETGLLVGRRSPGSGILDQQISPFASLSTDSSGTGNGCGSYF